MKRIFFFVGIGVIIILAGVLLFLLFASDAQKTAVFNAFNITNNDSGTGLLDTVVDVITGNDSTTDQKDALRQLTTRQVIGEEEIDPQASSTNPIVYFAEAGTGHVYTIDTVVGTETRLSNITIQTAHEALISRTGEYAVIASDRKRDGQQLTLVTLPKTGVELSSFSLNELAKDFTLTKDNYILYSTVAADVLTVRAFDIAKKEVVTLFTLPFKEATVRFGDSRDAAIYVYPKTAEKLEGYLYTVKAGKLERLPVAGYGLDARVSENTVLYSANVSGTYSSYLFNLEDSSTSDLGVLVIPEKCSFVSGELVLCGSSTSYDASTATKWFKGSLFANDDLWLIDTNASLALNLITPKDVAARDFDIATIHTSRDLSRTYFINRIDNSLWLFEQLIAPVQ